MSANTPQEQYHATIEKLFLTLTEKMDRLVEKVDDRFDSFRQDMTDVRDRLMRIEAQDQPAKLKDMENRVKDLSKELDASKQDVANYKLALEKRLTRTEIVLGPIFSAGSALIAAIVGVVVTRFVSG